jgi:hypothetical protein
LHVGQNPENAVEVALYKQLYQRQGEEWIPDRLQPVKEPYEGSIGDLDSPIPNQTAQAFLLDLRVPAGAPVRRIKVEPQLWVDGRWVIYPMEVRVTGASIPDGNRTAGRIGPVSEPADAPAVTALKSYLCGRTGASGVDPLTLRAVIQRNALQDVALAQSQGKDAETARRIIALAGAASSDAFCAAGGGRRASSPEWYLKVRDAITAREAVQ